MLTPHLNNSNNNNNNNNNSLNKSNIMVDRMQVKNSANSIEGNLKSFVSMTENEYVQIVLYLGTIRTMT